MPRAKQALLGLGLAALLIPALPSQLQSQEVCAGVTVDLVIVEFYVEYCEDVDDDEGSSDGPVGGGGGGAF